MSGSTGSSWWRGRIRRFCPQAPRRRRRPPLAGGRGRATVRILLPRFGGAIHESSARTLARARLGAAGRRDATRRPLTLSAGRFPARQPPALAMAGGAAAPGDPAGAASPGPALLQALGAGPRAPATWTGSSRPCACAPRRSPRPTSVAPRTRPRGCGSDLLALHAAGRAAAVPPAASALLLRPDRRGPPAGVPGRGRRPGAVHRTRRAGQTWALPLRLGAVENNLYVLR